jgi:hypothetical protein
MFTDDAQSVPPALTGAPASLREAEFRQALDRFMASYLAEERRRLRGRSETWILRRLGPAIVRALECLGNAMSGNGRYPPAGIM